MAMIWRVPIVLAIGLAAFAYSKFKTEESVQRIAITNNTENVIKNIEFSICGKNHGFHKLEPNKTQSLTVKVDCEQALYFKSKDAEYLHKPIGGRYLSYAFDMDLKVTIEDSAIEIETTRVEYN